MCQLIEYTSCFGFIEYTSRCEPAYSGAEVQESPSISWIYCLGFYMSLILLCGVLRWVRMQHLKVPGNLFFLVSSRTKLSTCLNMMQLYSYLAMYSWTTPTPIPVVGVHGSGANYCKGRTESQYWFCSLPASLHGHSDAELILLCNIWFELYFDYT